MLFLRPYSLNPNEIEQVVAKLKHLLPEAVERQPDTTWPRIGILFDAFRPPITKTIQSSRM